MICDVILHDFAKVSRRGEVARDGWGVAPWGWIGLGEGEAAWDRKGGLVWGVADWAEAGGAELDSCGAG